MSRLSPELQAERDYLRDNGDGLFPDGVKSLQRERLYLGALVELDSRTEIPNAPSVSERIRDKYTVQILMGDKGFAHSILAGRFVLHFNGPRTGLYLALFDNHQSFFIDSHKIWDRIRQQSKTVNPQKYMVSALRGFIQTHLLANNYLTEKSSISLLAAGGLSHGNDQDKLLAYYRTLGFLPVSEDDPDKMSTTIERFLEYTERIATWSVDMNKLHSRYIQMPPDPHLWSHVYPMARTGTAELHI